MDRELIDSFPCVTLETGVKTDELYKEHGCDSCKEPAASHAVSFCTQCDMRMCVEHEEVGSILKVCLGLVMLKCY